MAITSYQLVRVGNLTTVTVVSDLSPGAGEVIHYHWYADGAVLAATVTPVHSFVLAPGDQVRIVAQDTLDPDYDPVANAPAGWPARRTLWWVRSLDDDVDRYRAEQKKGDENWTSIGEVHAESSRWTYSLLTPRLEDLSDYTWRILPVDAAGNDGAALTVGPERIVRTPDAPDFAVTFDEGTTRVEFVEV